MPAPPAGRPRGRGPWTFGRRVFRQPSVRLLPVLAVRTHAMEQTRLQRRYRITLPQIATRRRTSTRLMAWLAPFAISFTGVWLGSFILVEALDLRFCQPYRQEHMDKVRFFQTEVPS